VPRCSSQCVILLHFPITLKYNFLRQFLVRFSWFCFWSARPFCVTFSYILISLDPQETKIFPLFAFIYCRGS